jgi:hypothetical protein
MTCLIIGRFDSGLALALFALLCRLTLEAFGRGAGATFAVFAAWIIDIYVFTVLVTYLLKLEARGRRVKFTITVQYLHA